MGLKSCLLVKRLVAVFLVAFVAVGTVANACAMSCAGHQMNSAAMSDMPADAPPCDQCPQAQLCDFAFATVIISSLNDLELLRAPHEPVPLIVDAYRFDPRPPLKPPVA